MKCKAQKATAGEGSTKVTSGAGFCVWGDSSAIGPVRMQKTGMDHAADLRSTEEIPEMTAKIRDEVRVEKK